MIQGTRAPPPTLGVRKGRPASSPLPAPGRWLRNLAEAESGGETKTAGFEPFAGTERFKDISSKNAWKLSSRLLWDS